MKIRLSAVLGLLAATLTVAHAREATPVSLKTHQIGPGVYTFTHEGARNIF